MSYSEKGFTLLEMMIVVAIIGILVAVAFPGYNSYRNYNSLDMEARSMAVNLRYIGQIAYDQGSEYRINFLSDKITYKAESEKESKTFKIGSGVVFDSIEPSGELIIARSGKPSDSTAHKIKLKRGTMNVYVIVGAGGVVDVSWD